LREALTNDGSSSEEVRRVLQQALAGLDAGARERVVAAMKEVA
jgi:hypothetical protein